MDWLSQGITVFSYFKRGFLYNLISGCQPKENYLVFNISKKYYSEKVSKRMNHYRCLVKEGDPLYCYYDKTELKYIVHKSHMKEIAYIDNVRQFENDKGCKGACITFRIPVSNWWNMNPKVENAIVIFFNHNRELWNCVFFLFYCN